MNNLVDAIKERTRKGRTMRYHKVSHRKQPHSLGYSSASF